MLEYVILLIVACVALPVSYKLLLRRRLPRDLAVLTRQRKLVWHFGDAQDLPTRYCQLYLFNLGHDRRAGCLLSGPLPAGQITAFQYSYKLGPSQRWAGLRWTAAVLETSTTRPGTFMGTALELIRAGPFARYRSIRPDPIESPPLRSSLFCESPAALQSWLERGLERFLADQDQAIVWELRGRLVAGYLPGPVEPARLDRLIDGVVRLHELTTCNCQSPLSTKPQQQ